MSTKTIALDNVVYEKLAREKREGESFSRTIDRLLRESASRATGGEILRGLGALPAMNEAVAEEILAAVKENRETEEWGARDLR